MHRDSLIIAAALSAALAIIAGAFGAHGASGRAAELLHTGGQYQLIHAVAALAVNSRAGGRRIAWMLLAGAGLFAATLYLMALGAPPWMGVITPIGGLVMIGGWLWLVIEEVRRSRE